MPISSALLDGLRKLPELEESTWPEWSKTMGMFFRGCGAGYITDATDKSTVPDASKVLDGELVWTIYSHVHSDYQSIIEDERSGLAAWQKLSARFEKSTRSRRITARTKFYRAEHDPSLPIDVYINKVKAAAKTLKGLKCDPGDIETTDILLMNLHPSWSTVRTTITSNKDEQKLDAVIDILIGSTVDPPVKEEDDIPALSAMAASAARFSSGGRKGGPGGGNGYSGQGGNGYGGGGGHHHGSGNGGGSHNTDDQGYHWCDPTNENHCHRCGRSGHIAARCIHDMPQRIKDWVMDGSRRERANTATVERAQNVYTRPAYDYDDGDGDDYVHSVSASDVPVLIRV